MSLSRILCLTVVAGSVFLAGFAPGLDISSGFLEPAQEEQQTAILPIPQPQADGTCGDSQDLSVGPCLEPSGWT